MEVELGGTLEIHGEKIYEVIAGLDDAHRRRPNQPLHLGVR